MVGQVVGMGRCWRRKSRERMDFLVGLVVWDAVFKGWRAGRWRRGEVWTRFG